MRAAMTTRAGGCLAVAGLDRLGMQATVIDYLLIGMAPVACDLRRGGLVHGTLDVSVAVHAGEHAAVDGILELRGIHVQTDWLAGDLFGEGRVTVASQTVVVGRLLRAGRGQ